MEMNNTREEVAVAEAIWDADDYNDYPFSNTTDDTKKYNIALAKAAIAASNSQYVPMLVEALKRVLNRAMVHDHEGYEEIAKQALNNLPTELRG